MDSREITSYTMPEVKTMYYDWVKSIVGCGLNNDLTPDESYDTLIFFLHHIEYYWSIRMDENRAGDGVALRMNFFTNTRYQEWRDTKNCDPYLDYINKGHPNASVFEVMAAFAFRKADSYFTAPILFRLMLKHLGIYQFVDSTFAVKSVTETGPDIDYIHRRVSLWLDGEYEEGTGKDALWPSEVAQGKEIWEQYNAWQMRHDWVQQFEDENGNIWSWYASDRKEDWDEECHKFFNKKLQEYFENDQF